LASWRPSWGEAEPPSRALRVRGSRIRTLYSRLQPRLHGAGRLSSGRVGWREPRGSLY
jgi:hypothetical protein